MHVEGIAHDSVKNSLAALAIEATVKPEDIRPIGDQILVKADAPEEFSGSIYIPQTARAGMRKYLRTGKVLATGLGDILDAEGTRGPMFCRVGDHVIYDQASNRVVKLDGEEYLILHEEQHIIAVLDDSLPFETL